MTSTGGRQGDGEESPPDPSTDSPQIGATSDLDRLAERLEASRERGRRDALDRITRYPEGPPRQRAASTLVVTILQQTNERSPDDDLSRAYVAGVIEVAEQVLGRHLDVPGPPPSSGGPDAGPTERNEQ